MTDYDRVPYPCHAYADTHPDHLHAMGRLHGMSPAPTDRCRVLEVGCGDGGNLLPMAARRPDCTFFGFDLAETSIAAGRRVVEEWGLKNLDLRHMDLMDFPESEGPFDYIIGHGFYSWVPPFVRERLLELVKRLLAPQGIAFISYNAYPGGHIRSMVRDMVNLHVANAPDTQSKLAQARAFLGFLLSGMADADEHGRLLKAEVERVLKFDPSHFFHDDLAAINQSFYVHEFAAQAAAKGLQYLGDADFAASNDNRYAPEVRQKLEELENAVQREQYLDFLKCRRFRQTLLCHDSLTLTHPARPAAVRGLWFGGSILTDAAKPNEWRSPRGARIRTPHPVAKAALDAIGERWPSRWDFPALAQCVEAQTGGPTAAVEEVLEKVLWEALCTGMIDLWPERGDIVTEVSARPVVCPLARRMLAGGEAVVTLLHGTVGVGDAMGRHLVSLCDGSRDSEALVRGMAEFPEIVAQSPDPAQRLAFARENVETGLAQLAQLALLVA